MVEKVASQSHMLRVVAARLGDAAVIEAKHACAGQTKEHGRVRGDDELRDAATSERVHQAQERQLPLGRERRFGLVQQEESPLEAMLEEGEERFAM